MASSSQPPNTLCAINYNEGAHVAKRRGRPSKADRLAREGRSMGRYPLMAAAEAYLERRSVQVGRSTMANERRITRHIVGEIEAMRRREDQDLQPQGHGAGGGPGLPRLDAGPEIP